MNCSPDMPKLSKKDTETQSSGGKSKTDSLNANASEFAELKIPPKISVTDIESAEFALIGLNVGLADKVAGQVPSVNYLMPQKADFVQIMRCRADAQLGELFDIDQNTTNSTVAWKKFIVKDYWQLATQNSNCVMVSASFSGSTYFDVFAPNDSWRYLARACASRERIVDIGDLPVGDCGRWISVTQTLPNFVNKNLEKENEAQKKSREERDRADTLVRRAYFLTVEMNAEFLKCDKQWEKGAKNKAKRDAMFGFLKTGSAATMAAFSYSAPVNVGEILDGINLIFSSPNDFQRTCVFAEKLRRDGEEVNAQLQIIGKQWPELVKKAGDGQ